MNRHMKPNLFGQGLLVICVCFFMMLWSACTSVEFTTTDRTTTEQNRSVIRLVSHSKQASEETVDLKDPSIRLINPIPFGMPYRLPIDTAAMRIHPHAKLSYYPSYSFDLIIDGNIYSTYDFEREEPIVFPSAYYYNAIEGVTTFRGNNYRNTASYGYSDVQEGALEIVWHIGTGSIDAWTGVGWTGQPAIVKWPVDTMQIMNINDEKQDKESLVEVIIAAMDGRIYFLDLDDGTATRPVIRTGWPIKGGVTVDPRGYPLLYAGQGVNTNRGVVGQFHFWIFSLIDQSVLHIIIGDDPHAHRNWGAFDANPLIDAATDTMIQCGESGIIYTARLNTDYRPQERHISVDPTFINFRYLSPFGTRIGVENSPVGFKNLVFFADNTGLLQCLDINTMQPIWIFDLTDDTDSTMILEEVSTDQVYLYTACEVDHQQHGGSSYMRKLHALTGELLWERSVRCYYVPGVVGGALASPVLGEYEISDYIIFNIARTHEEGASGGRLFALNKHTGESIWEKSFQAYAWSSPVAVYDQQGRAFLIVCDSAGYMHLLDAVTGETLDRIFLGANIEASPAVYDDMIVVGTRGQQIYGIRIK